MALMETIPASAPASAPAVAAVEPTPEREQLLDRIYEQMTAQILASANCCRLPARTLAREAADFQRQTLLDEGRAREADLDETLAGMASSTIYYLAAHKRLGFTTTNGEYVARPTNTGANDTAHATANALTNSDPSSTEHTY